MSRKDALTFTVPEEVQHELEALAFTRQERSNVVLFRRGEPAKGVYVLRKGSVVLSFDDRRHRTAGQGWVLGLPATFSGEPYSLTAVTAENCEFCLHSARQGDRIRPSESGACGASVGSPRKRGLHNAGCG